MEFPLHHAHRWDVSPKEARLIQQQMCHHVVERDLLPERIATVAGIDAGFENGGKVTRAAVAVLSFPKLELVESAVVRLPTQFPYVPGLLSFREIPAVIEAMRLLTILPDLILCDGQGRAHPLRFGIASHLGVLLNMPTIGVAKSRLIGEHVAVPARKGAWVELTHKEEVIGAVLRTRAGVRPLFVSTGHRVSLPTALDFTLRCVGRYRLPETTRQAHALASG